MQSSENFFSLNEDGQYTRFFQGLRPTIDTLEQELGSDGCQSDRVPPTYDAPEEKLFGPIKKADFKKILDSYDLMHTNQQPSEDILEKTVSCDTDTYKNFAQLLHSKPAFHNYASTDYLTKDLKITDIQRLSLLGHSFGISDFRVDEAESLGKLLKCRRNELMKSNLAAAYNYLNGDLFIEALNEIKLALEIDPENGNARAALGRYYFRAQDYQKAIDELRIALKFGLDDKKQVEKDLARTLERLGERHFAKHEYAQARDKFIEALELGSDNPDLTVLHRNICEEKIELAKKQSPFAPFKDQYRK